MLMTRSKHKGTELGSSEKNLISFPVNKKIIKIFIASQLTLYFISITVWPWSSITLLMILFEFLGIYS